MKRECGSCGTCCVLAPVVELGKRPGQQCWNLGPASMSCGRCWIYSQRPSACSAYVCSWIEGLLPVELRPDKCGVLCETLRTEHDGQTITMVMAMPFDEALAASFRMKLLDAAGGSVAVVWFSRGEDIAIASRSKLAEAVAAAVIAQWFKERRAEVIGSDGKTVMATPSGVFVDGKEVEYYR